MGKFDKVLIASDFDGTLKNDDGIITDKVKQAIAYFISEGGYFTVCTGRAYMGFHLYDPSYINAPVLLANGTTAYDYEKEQIVFMNGMGKECFDAVRAVRDNFPTASIEMYAFNETFAIHMSEHTKRHFTGQDIPFKTIDDPSQSITPWIKVMINADEKTSQQIQKFLKDNFDDPSFLATTGTFIEVLKKGADKGTGLLQLADALGVSHKDCYAVGDGYNDIEMLEAAAGGFVPCNGSKEALDVATYVVRSNNDDAVANVIEILDAKY